MISIFFKLHRVPSKLLYRKGILHLLDAKAPVYERFVRYATCPSSPCEVKDPPCETKPPCGGGGGGGGKHQISYKPYVPPCYKDHDHKNMELNRPMSPHLTVYGPTVPAMTSIVQRATGTILTFYALGLAGGALFLPNGYPFTFHYFIGIRFVLWNMGKLLGMKEIYSSAYASIVGAAALAALFAMI